MKRFVWSLRMVVGRGGRLSLERVTAMAQCLMTNLTKRESIFQHYQ